VPPALISNGVFGRADTTIWASVLARLDDPDTVEFPTQRRRIRLTLDNGPTPMVEIASDGGFEFSPEKGTFVRRNTWTLTSLAIGGSETLKPSTALSLLVMRFQFTSGIDFVDMWVNPDLSAPLTGANRDALVSGNLTFDRLTLIGELGNVPNGQVGSFDEFRIGTDLASVLPEPTAALCGLLAIPVMLARRTRRRVPQTATAPAASACPTA
jgi:hypothetical protein